MRLFHDFSFIIIKQFKNFLQKKDSYTKSTFDFIKFPKWTFILYVKQLFETNLQKSLISPYIYAQFNRFVITLHSQPEQNLPPIARVKRAFGNVKLI